MPWCEPAASASLLHSGVQYDPFLQPHTVSLLFMKMTSAAFLYHRSHRSGVRRCLVSCLSGLAAGELCSTIVDCKHEVDGDKQHEYPSGCQSHVEAVTHRGTLLNGKTTGKPQNELQVQVRTGAEGGLKFPQKVGAGTALKE